MVIRHDVRILLTVLLVLATAQVRADSPSLLVGLHIQAVRLNLQYAGTVRQTDLSSLDLLWHEPLNSWLDGSIKLGVLDVTQGSNPIAAGQSTSGNSLGLGLRFHLYRGDYLQLRVLADYLYADTHADTSGQSVETRWHQLSGQLESEIRLPQYCALTFAIGALAVDGDEVATGTIDSVQTFKAEKPGFARLGFKLGIDPTSHIGIEVSTGSIAGGRISFQRWF